MRASLIAIALSLVASSPVLAQQAEPTFSADEVRAHISYLADDLLEGRDAGTRGYDVAARYVATRLEALGLKPGGPNGSWYQQVPLKNVGFDPAKPATLNVGGETLANGKQVIIGPGDIAGDEILRGGIVFVGHGLPADYAGLDVKGKFVVALLGAPSKLNKAQAAAAQSVDKRGHAASLGAVGLISLVPAERIKKDFPWSMLAHMANSGRTALAGNGVTKPAQIPQMYINPEGASTIFKGATQSADAVFAAAAKGGSVKGFALTPDVTLSRTTAVRTFTSPNVVAVLPGSDPALASEYVVLTAHLDHNGIDPSAPGDDKIFNGAMDNAAGVATMLEAARAFKQSGVAPKRSILFAAVTAEEDGLLGSEYLATNPVTNPGKVVANVNLDMPVLLYDFTDVVAFGAEHSTLGPIVSQAAAKMQVKLTPDPMPQENLFVRSDHYSFVKAGVPSVFLVTGFANGGEKHFRDFLANHYHRPSDQVTLPFNWEAGAKFAKINYLIANEIANAPTAPRWYQGNLYGDKFAKDAPKAPAPTGAPTGAAPAKAPTKK